MTSIKKYLMVLFIGVLFATGCSKAEKEEKQNDEPEVTAVEESSVETEPEEEADPDLVSKEYEYGDIKETYSYAPNKKVFSASYEVSSDEEAVKAFKGAGIYVFVPMKLNHTDCLIAVMLADGKYITAYNSLTPLMATNSDGSVIAAQDPDYFAEYDKSWANDGDFLEFIKESLKDFVENNTDLTLDFSSYGSDEKEESSDKAEIEGTEEQKAALKKALSYLSFKHYSRAELIHQLVFEEFSEEDATWAADNCGADWNENAIETAKGYIDFKPYSYAGLIRQLINGNNFTEEEATYGVDNCEADWSEQAVRKAKGYIDKGGYSKEDIIERLAYEEFTQDQIDYAIEQVYNE